MPRVVHFEITAENPDANAEFYKEVFGWKVQKWEGPSDYWLFTTGEEGEAGIDGGMGKREEGERSVINTIDVPDAHAFAARVEKYGGKVVNPVHAVLGVGWLAYIEDPDGNTWGIMQEDPQAK